MTDEIAKPESAGPSRRSEWRRLTVGKVVIGLPLVVVGVLFLGALFDSMFSSARPAARRMACSNHLKQVGMALFAYHEAHGCFPPAYTVDEEGNRLHSWRTLILPYLDCQVLYGHLDLSQPWDSPYNRKFVDRRMPIYQCPRAKSPPAETNYMMVLGPDTVSDGTSTTSLDDVVDPKSRTFLLVEVVDMGVHWAEPWDLPLENLLLGINAKPGVSASSRHAARGLHVLRMDGSVAYAKPYGMDPVLSLWANKSDGAEASKRQAETIMF